MSILCNVRPTLCLGQPHSSASQISSGSTERSRLFCFSLSSLESVQLMPMPQIANCSHIFLTWSARPFAWCVHVTLALFPSREGTYLMESGQALELVCQENSEEAMLPDIQGQAVRGFGSSAFAAFKCCTETIVRSSSLPEDEASARARRPPINCQSCE